MAQLHAYASGAAATTTTTTTTTYCCPFWNYNSGRIYQEAMTVPAMLLGGGVLDQVLRRHGPPPWVRRQRWEQLFVDSGLHVLVLPGKIGTSSFGDCLVAWLDSRHDDAPSRAW
jgi:hypothetical protein